MGADTAVVIGGRAMVLNPPIDKIPKGLPVCQYPRGAYNRIAEILEHLKATHGLRMERGGEGGNHWTITADEEWLYHFIMAIVSPLVDQAEAAAENNALVSGHDLTDVTVRYLTGSGATASSTKWDYGDTTAGGDPVVPVVQPYRLYWDATNHQLLFFSREMYYTPDGMLYKVSAESSPQAVFTSVPENF